VGLPKHLLSLFHSQALGRLFWVNPFMDPITAAANLITEITKLVTVIIEGQTPEQRQQIWQWYIEDRERIRKWFKLD